MSKATPFLMFTGRAEEALTFYAASVPGGRIDAIDRYGPGEAGREGSVRFAEATLAGLRVFAIDSPAVHAFDFTPSFSLMLDCADLAEFERLVEVLGEGGGMLMPPGDYGFCSRYAWLNDRFGVSWQVRLA
ncbi:VOC family protein [Hephaestia mangrovi]|uniref:VOC family protein n=1 Tax=Hephaestia mangrovi TaxID=2873268 RepID=UPI001CA5F574|nr:VOC family protein [Hephaestia mangrovi]MBY8828038.1 VOC family protein [Hephaestia mangrovi]